MMMADDTTPEELWQHLAEESPHTSDDEIERLFITAAKDNEYFIRQMGFSITSGRSGVTFAAQFAWKRT
jgi:hypothetical protein